MLYATNTTDSDSSQVNCGQHFFNEQQQQQQQQQRQSRSQSHLQDINAKQCQAIVNTSTLTLLLCSNRRTDMRLSGRALQMLLKTICKKSQLQANHFASLLHCNTKHKIVFYFIFVLCCT